MKKLMLIAIAFLTLNATAQDKKNGRDQFNDLSAEEVATLKTKKLTLELDLTESQQASVKALVLKEAQHRELLRTKRQQQQNDEDFKKPSKEERYAMANERLDRQIEMKKQMKSILNAEQYTKWEATLANKKKGIRKARKDKRSGKRD